MRAAKVQASLRICAVSPEPPLLAHTSSESRGTFRQKARSLAPLNGWACAVKICHEGMLEDTNSLDAAHSINLQIEFVAPELETKRSEPEPRPHSTEEEAEDEEPVQESQPLLREVTIVTTTTTLPPDEEEVDGEGEKREEEEEEAQEEDQEEQQEEVLDHEPHNEKTCLLGCVTR